MKSSNIKLWLELIVLGSFFVSYKMGGLILGTKVLMIVSFLSAVLITFLHKKFYPSQMATLVLIQIMGSITLLSNDVTFIKMKPTILYSSISIALFFGMYFKKYFVKAILEPILEMDDHLWKKATISWSLYFVLCAVINEIVWRGFSEEFWVAFKVFAFVPMTLMFAALQLISFRKYIKL